MSTASRDRKARRRDFAANVRDGVGELRTHADHGWQYLMTDPVPVDPDAGPVDPERQANLYWALRGDVVFVQISPKWDDGPDPGLLVDGGFGPHDHPRLVVVTQGEPVTPELIEGTLAFAATRMPRRIGNGAMQRL